MRPRSVLLAVAAGLALADASVVTLALPQLLVDLHTTVEGVASVIGVYTVALALALIPIERATRRHGAPAVGAAGFVTFAVACIACAGADSLAVLLVARAVQAIGGAAALVATFSLLADGHDETGVAGAPAHAPQARTLWLGAAVLSAALGPALGGALTQAFSWPAIFIAQVPVAAAAALVCVRLPGPATAPPDPVATTPPAEPFDWRAATALGFVSAALSAVLFLLVLLLVAGWAVRPLAAAGTVTVVPAFALLAGWSGTRLGDARWRAAGGCVLVGFGTIALAYLPDARLWWTLAPQALAGFGMGLALPALGGELLPERDARDAARLLAIRHIGIAVALAVIAPITSARLDDATFKARERGVALVLDAKIDPARKLQLAPALLASVDTESPRRVLRQTIADNRAALKGAELADYDRLSVRADETLVEAVGQSFFAAFALTGLLALAGAGLLVRARPRAPGWAVGATVVGCAVLAWQVAEWHHLQPPAVTIADPCQKRSLPSTGGVTGFLQDKALEVLDNEACHYGSSREELVLALADDADARRFQREHGANPRSLGGLLGGLSG
ncbi:MFS transporter [Paraconexibacter antarcticus]|uniref:MFS transporter n=1 Tax=Paraconexibacter antarcticus TaxID=2949664 RepID=A0ABY5DVF0_9ACTN|nr:MFS transporter [Paraconexibacter antarcticus]UTI65278.1 MFS transporter [Paraconexibacter antarcticus]